MLRVTPDGKEVWVQTSEASTNVVLDADSLATLATTPVDTSPVTVAFQPGSGRYGLVMHVQGHSVVVLDRRSWREVARIDVGQTQANGVFSADGATAFVAVTGGNEIAAIDMGSLSVAGRIKTGAQPMGLVLLDPATM